MFYSLFLGCLFLLLSSICAAHSNDLAISQGISSPSYTTLSLYSNGFIFENPVAASYQNSYKATLSIDGSTSTSGGLDFGVGDTQYGLGLGIYSNGCDGCDAYIRGTLSAIWGGFGLGFGVQEDLYTMGLLFNPNGLHRVGIVSELEDPTGIDNKRGAVGLGYSYVLPSFTFSLDASKRFLEDTALDDNAVMLTPGMAVRVDIFSFSLSYDIFLNDPANNFSDQLWVGVGMRPFKDWHFIFYGEYVDRWSLVGTYTF